MCRSCLQVLDRAEWSQHDAGRLGADERGEGKELEDPPIGPVPVTGSPFGGVGAAAGRLFGAVTLLRRRRRG